jgi:8-oxo-dGTP diphosphatase
MAIVHVVIGIILNENREVLIAQRLSHQEKGGMWEFPGETPFKALQREFQEEIGIQVVSANAWMQVEYHYPHKSVLLDAWMIDHFTGEPHGAEGQPVEWGSVAVLKEREFPEGNKKIIQRLLDYL